MSLAAKVAFGTGVLLFIAFVVYSSTKLDEHVCEVCMEFNGLSSCATASGVNELEARNSAITVACANISSGVTQGISCSNTVPKSADCKEKR